MKLEVSKIHVETSDSIDKAIQHKVDKVEERLKRYHPDSADLMIHLEYSDKRKAFDCSLNLKAFRDSLHVKKSAPELRVAIDKSFDALMKELDHYRVKINKSLQQPD